jgi:7-cyano-7-deazaguanine synthase
MRTVVLLSGGLDSAVLFVEESQRGRALPVYISAGLAWEEAEREMVSRFLASLGDALPPLASLSVDMRDVYPATHWAVEGKPPGYHTPDEDVYLPGRNVILLAKAGVYCAAANADRIVLGTLGHNPFPDATPAFRTSMADALSIGLGHRVKVEAPYAEIEKAEVVRRGNAVGVRFDLTLSCMSPVWPSRDAVPRHCGLCSKCRERHHAFLEAGIEDPTDYADRGFVQGTGLVQ